MPTAPMRTAIPTKKSTTVRTGFEAISRALRSVAAVSPRLAASLASTLFFVCPPRRKASGDESAILARGRRRTIATGGSKVFAWSWNHDGPVVLLVHGWGGNGSQLHAFVDPLLRAGFRPVMVDLPGHGLSPGVRSSLPVWAEALRVVATAFAGRPAVHGIVAHSFGAAAVTLALDRGLEAERVLMLAPIAEPGDYYRGFVGTAAASSESALAGATQAMERRLGVRLAALSVPAMAPRQRASLLVVHDRDDRESPVDAGAAIARAWPGGRLVTTRGLGHRRVLTTATVVARGVAFATAGLQAEQRCASPTCGRPVHDPGLGLCSTCALDYELAHPHLRWVRGAERCA